MESSRNLATGDITVKTASFAVHVRADGLAVKVGDTVVHEWRFEEPVGVAAAPESQRRAVAP
jgi:hypothetical protein